VNESLRRLDAIIQLGVVSATTAAEPASPADGAVYILPAGKTGADWSAFAAGSLGYYRDGAWVEIVPREGWLAFVKDSDQLLAWTGSAWSLFPAAKLLVLSATDRLLGRSSSGAGPAEEIACTAAGRALIDDADAAAQRTTLGLGNAATQNTGTSGANAPLLNGANTWSAQQVVNLASGGAPQAGSCATPRPAMLSCSSIHPPPIRAMPSLPPTTTAPTPSISSSGRAPAARLSTSRISTLAA
jgi:hypothetical protein